MSFRLEFQDEGPDEHGYRRGTIQLGELPETFRAQVRAHWSEADYEASWRAALERALAGDPAALITDAEPGNWFATWWPLYPRPDGGLWVQQQLLFEEPPGWAWENPWNHVPQREVEGEDGPISEWTLEAASLRDWLAPPRH